MKLLNERRLNSVIEIARQEERLSESWNGMSGNESVWMNYPGRITKIIMNKNTNYEKVKYLLLAINFISFINNHS